MCRYFQVLLGFCFVVIDKIRAAGRNHLIAPLRHPSLQPTCRELPLRRRNALRLIAPYALRASCFDPGFPCRHFGDRVR